MSVNPSHIYHEACIKEALPWRRLKADQKSSGKTFFSWGYSITDLPVQLFLVLLLLLNPHKIKLNCFDEVVLQWDKWAGMWTVEGSGSHPECSFVLPSPGMTMEVLGTLIGAALQGQIVASAHHSHNCTTNPPLNTTSPNDSWHDSPSYPEPSDSLSHQVSVCGSTGRSLWERTTESENGLG